MGDTPVLMQHPTAPTLHPAGSRGATRELWVALKVSPGTRSSCKACKWEDDGAGEVWVAPALGTVTPPPARTLPESFPAGPHPDPERGALSPEGRSAQPAQSGLESRQGWHGDTAPVATTSNGSTHSTQPLRGLPGANGPG